MSLLPTPKDTLRRFVPLGDGWLGGMMWEVKEKHTLIGHDDLYGPQYEKKVTALYTNHDLSGKWKTSMHGAAYVLALHEKGRLIEVLP